MTLFQLLPENIELYHLYVGKNPLLWGECADQFKQKNIKTAIVLLEDLEEVRFFYNRRLGVQLIHFPIKDFSVPNSTKAVSDLALKVNEALESGNVFMHCYGGKGRTGMIAACLKLSNITAMTSKEAITFTRSIIDNSIETRAQERFIHEYAELVRCRNLTFNCRF